MLATHEDGSIDFGEMDEDDFCEALEHFEDCLDTWDGEPRVLIAAVIRIISEIVDEAQGPIQ
jgi:hypothetical protein